MGRRCLARRLSETDSMYRSNSSASSAQAPDERWIPSPAGSRPEASCTGVNGCTVTATSWPFGIPGSRSSSIVLPWMIPLFTSLWLAMVNLLRRIAIKSSASRIKTGPSCAWLWSLLRVPSEHWGRSSPPQPDMIAKPLIAQYGRIKLRGWLIFWEKPELAKIPLPNQSTPRPPPMGEANALRFADPLGHRQNTAA